MRPGTVLAETIIGTMENRMMDCGGIDLAPRTGPHNEMPAMLKRWRGNIKDMKNMQVRPSGTLRVTTGK
jgi:hypothetical protein